MLSFLKLHCEHMVSCFGHYVQQTGQTTVHKCCQTQISNIMGWGLVSYVTVIDMNNTVGISCKIPKSKFNFYLCCHFLMNNFRKIGGMNVFETPCVCYSFYL